MACNHCAQVRKIHIATPDKLPEAISRCKSFLDKGVLKQSTYWVPGDPTQLGPRDFLDAKPETCDDTVKYYFECPCCGQLFRLCVDLYHGSGGSLETFHEGPVYGRTTERKMCPLSRFLHEPLRYDRPISERPPRYPAYSPHGVSTDNGGSSARPTAGAMLLRTLSYLLIGAVPLALYPLFTIDVAGNAPYKLSFKYLALPFLTVCFTCLTRSTQGKLRNRLQRIFMVTTLSLSLAGVMTVISGGYFIYANMLIGRQDKVELRGTVIEKRLGKSRLGGTSYSLLVWSGEEGSLLVDVSQSEYRTLNKGDLYRGTWIRGGLGFLYRARLGQ
jgi:hypothetical protein